MTVLGARSVAGQSTMSSANLARGCSSAGRAPALQAGGHRFDPGQLHHVAAQWKRQIKPERANGDRLALERASNEVSLRLLFRSLTIWNDPSIEVEYGFDKRRTVFFKFMYPRLFGVIWSSE